MQCQIVVGDAANSGGKWTFHSKTDRIEQEFVAEHVSSKTPVDVSCTDLAIASAYGCPQNFDNPPGSGSMTVTVVAGP